LFLKDSALSAPHERPKPRKGDIVTFFIYYPAYKKRSKVDWRASPYNIAHREKYIDPKTNPQAAAWWHSPVPSAPINLPPVKPGHVTRTVQDEQASRKREEADKKASEADKYRILDEDDINFYILMSTTGENTDKAIKRPKFEGHYVEYLRGDMGDGPLGSAYHFGALTKVFFFSRVAELTQYLQTGKWEGKEWDGGKDEDESGNKKNYVFSPGRPVRKDIYNRPLKVNTPWYKAWDKTPSVDRNLVKVRRFDYFGHSDAENMILLYGWENEKGEPPDYDHTMTIAGLEKCFQGKVLTHDAVAALWGCNLGANMEDGSPGIAPRLAEKLFPGGAVAADQRTTFDHVLDNDYAMPEPMPDYVWDAAKNAWVEVKGTWKFYPHKKGKAAGAK
jgi:hypothetical protein